MEAALSSQQPRGESHPEMHKLTGLELGQCSPPPTDCNTLHLLQHTEAMDTNRTQNLLGPTGTEHHSTGAPHRTSH